MSNTFSKSSIYVDSLVDFTRDTKPYHSKLTEVAVEYRFEDTVNVSIIDTVASRMVKKAGWVYSYFSGGDVSNRTFDIKRLVAPNIRRNEKNNDQSNTPGAFKVGRDENLDMTNVPYVFDKQNTVGIADAWLERNGTRVEYLVQGNDFHHSYGSMELRASLPSPADTDQSMRWQETRSEGVLAEVTSTTRYLANRRIDETLPWSELNSDPNSANFRIRQVLNAIQAQLVLTPNPSASANLTSLFTILDTPDLPQSYEGLWETLEAGATPLIINPVTGLPFTAWRGEDGAPVGATYVDDYISSNTPSAYFYSLSDLRSRETGGAVYLNRTFPGFSVSNIQVAPGSAVDEWELLVTGDSPVVVQVSGTVYGYIGAFTAGSSFNSTYLTFDTAVAAGTATVGDTYILTPTSRVVVDTSAPQEVWNLIKTDPLAHSRPTFTSLRYGSIRSLTNVVGEVTILDVNLPTGTVVLTALNSTTFALSSTAEPGYTGTVTVGTVFNDGRLGFTLIAGTAQAFAAGDRFYINIINEPARAEEFDLYYGYDLDSYDNQTAPYENQNPLDPLHNVPLGFRFDSRFSDYDLSSMNLQISQSAISGYRYRLTARADGDALTVLQSDGSSQNNFIDLAGPGGGTVPIYSMPGDANPAPDISVFLSNNFKLERSTDGGNTWTTIQAMVPVGVPYSNPAEGISFTITPGSKPFIGVVTDTPMTGGDVFMWTVVNEPPHVDPIPVIYASPNLPRLIMHGSGFWDAPAANWTITFTSSAAYSVNAIATSGPGIGSPVPGYPVTGNINIPGTGVNRNLTFKNDHVHFTINRGRRGFAAGDVFRFSTYDDKPSILVHGSTSGWQEDAQIGKWYWNGKIGFKVNSPVAQVFKNGDAILPGDIDFNAITVARVRPDTPELVYTFTRLMAGSPSTTTFTVNRSDVGVIGHCQLNSQFKDQYITVAITAPTTSFQVSITPDPLQFWNAQDTVVVRPLIPAMVPTTSDFFAFKKAHNDRLGINLDYTNVLAIPDTAQLGLTAVDTTFIDISTGGVPIQTHSPEAIIFNGWVPLVLEGYDAVSSIAHFPDTAIEVKVKSAVSGEAVGRVYSDGTLNEPIRFEWDSAFFNKYLPLNSSSNVVLYNSFMNENVRVLISERVNFFQGGGVLAEDALFNDNVFVSITEDNEWSINLNQFEDISAVVTDGPFGGFLPGFSNLPYDAETLTDISAILGEALIGSFEISVSRFEAPLFVTETVFPQTVTLPFNTDPAGLTLITGPAVLASANSISISGPGKVTVLAYGPFLGGGTSTSFVEDFSGGLTGFTLVSGNIGIFSSGTSPYGSSFNIAAQNSPTVSSVRKDFAPIQMEELTFYLRLNTLNPDDAAALLIQSSTGESFASISPVREAFFDPLRRPIVRWRNTPGGPNVVVTLPTALTAGVWYRARFYLDGGSRMFSLTNETTGVVQTVVLTTAASAATVSRMVFSADASGLTSSMSYAEVKITSPSTAVLPIGRYDTGAPLVDNFMRAQFLSTLSSPSAQESQELLDLLSIIDAFLQPGGIGVTTLPQFLAAINSDNIVLPRDPEMGLPSQGVAMDINKTDANTAATSFSEAATFLSIEDANQFDEEGYDAGGLDIVSDSTSILLAVTNPPIPGGAIPATYGALNTPLYTGPGVEARNIEVSFAVPPVSTPNFQFWTPLAPAPLPVTVVEQISARRFKFSLATESEVKVIVT